MNLARIVAPIVALASVAVADPATAAPRAVETIPGRYVVVYADSVSEPGRETDERQRRHGFRASHRYGSVVKGFAAKLSSEQAGRLRRDSRVAAVVPDRRVRAVGVAVAGGEGVPTGVKRVGAVSGGQARGASPVGVAVIDTGIDATHPDLTVGEGINCVTPGAAPRDGHGHGTHVAGTIAARNQGTGVLGVAPGTVLHPVKVLDDSGQGSSSQILCGIDWVTSNAARLNLRVANMSLGGPGWPVASCATTTDPEHLAICSATRAGVTFTVAAGNDGWDFDYARTPDTPAAYPEVLTVSAVSDSDGAGGATGGALTCGTGGTDDAYASFSNYAATTAGAAHLIAAPGSCIRSTWPGGGHSTSSGTSMAAPHVAGVAALCLGETGVETAPCAGLAPAQVIAKLRDDADAATRENPTFGFLGDPLRPVSGRTYGFITPVGASAAAAEPVSSEPAPTKSKAYEAAPSSGVLSAGSLRSGSIASLSAADGVLLRVDSTTNGTRVSDWYGRFSGLPSALSDLVVTYRGGNSRSCAQVVSAYRFSTGAWVTLDSRSMASATTITAPVGSDPQSLVSAGGEMRVRVRCSASRSFTANADLLRIAYRAA